jgi:AcrR family transcriptional regulator
MESGVAALAVEHVAARSGVAKATIYRRWPNKDALVLDALTAVDEPDPELPGTSLRDDLIAISESVVGRAAGSGSSQLYAWMVAESQRCPDIVRKYRSLVIERRREIVRAALRSWQEKGELRADLDIETAVLLVVAPMLVYKMHWYPGEAVPPGLAEQLADVVLEGLAATCRCGSKATARASDS